MRHIALALALALPTAACMTEELGSAGNDLTVVRPDLVVDDSPLPPPGVPPATPDDGISDPGDPDGDGVSLCFVSGSGGNVSAAETQAQARADACCGGDASAGIIRWTTSCNAGRCTTVADVECIRHDS